VQQSVQQQQQLCTPATSGRVHLAPDVSKEMAIQGMPPDDERHVSPIGNQPSVVSSGLAANQFMPPEGKRPESPIGNQPLDVRIGSAANQGMPPEDERPASPIGNQPSVVSSGLTAN
jgi:hypothetical protein